jgi:hypothetical protein
MAMYDEKTVLCGSNAYEQKYYFNEEFSKLPDYIKDELKIMSVLFTEEVGGIFTMSYDEEGNLSMDVEYDELDLLFDEIGCGLKIRQLQREKVELFEALEMFYKVFVLGEENV